MYFLFELETCVRVCFVFTVTAHAVEVPASKKLSVSSACNEGIKRRARTTPVLAWNTWNRFGCNVSESLISAANNIVSLGLRDWATITSILTIADKKRLEMNLGICRQIQ